jgi:hypothetical protein
MLNNYTTFLGKVCTILTNPTPFPFRDAKQHASYFSGLVTEINEEGIFLKNLVFKTMAFFTFPIIGIIEEIGVAEDDPNFEKVKMEVEKAKTPAKPVQVQARPAVNKDFTSIEDMTTMAKQIKSTRPYTRQSS